MSCGSAVMHPADRIGTSLKEEKLVDIRREVSETLVPAKKYKNGKYLQFSG
jgi:hypothetical protein